MVDVRRARAMRSDFSLLLLLLHAQTSHAVQPIEVSSNVVARFAGYSMQPSLAFALTAASAAATVASESGIAHAQRRLTDALASDVAGRWVGHVDEHHVVVAMLAAEAQEPILALVHGASEIIFGTEDGGVYVSGSDGDRACVSGDASPTANVLNLPRDGQWCPQLDRCAEHAPAATLQLLVSSEVLRGTSAIEEAPRKTVRVSVRVRVRQVHRAPRELRDGHAPPDHTQGRSLSL